MVDAPPWVAGIIQRVCDPPGPLKLPLLINSQEPVAATAAGSPHKGYYHYSQVPSDDRIHGHSSPYRYLNLEWEHLPLALDQIDFAANQEVHGT